jgi:hypothetical protein
MAKIRKAYQGRKYVAKNPLKTFFGGMQETHYEHLQTTLLINHTSMSNMARGVGDKEDWDRIVGAINIALIMTEQGSAPDHVELLKQAQAALIEVGKRAVKNNMRFLFKGPELGVLNDAMEVHDLQLQTARAIDIDRAADEVKKRVRHKIGSTNIMRELAKEATC